MMMPSTMNPSISCRFSFSFSGSPPDSAIITFIFLVWSTSCIPFITREANGVTISGTITPTVLVCPYLRLIATGFGLYPNLLAASITFSFVSLRIFLSSPNARDTVETDIDKCRAMSFMVIYFMLNDGLNQSKDIDFKQ